MSIDARLNKLMPALSARERAILVLRSLKENTPEDPAWRGTMPREQAREFSRLIVLMNACNIYLPLYITVVEQKTEQMNLRLTLIRTMAHFGSALWHLGALVPAAKHKKAQQVVEGVFPVIELPWDGEEHEYSWLNVADQMAETLKQAVLYLCEDLRAIDIVVGRVAEEFVGEDPLRPIMRSVVENTREQLRLLLQAVCLDEPIAWPEPTVETMELVEGYFEKGKRLMEGI